ncbi:AraC family transcriptional regulator [Cohnella fermenti]|uniref:AraC family transcriptional regulator n=1 Tax=Cohnella fermenti TaxID=2565925 RepID=A0A4S4BTV9_9BACL|nr:AraC family transcriptional regulator [Cohnella fermenti]THF77770.1 AraC family transcriptional regulator [Cohnella fermenti]
MQAQSAGSFQLWSPTVNYAGRTVSEPGYRWGPRLIPDHHLIYLLSGVAELRLGNRAFELRAGDIGLYGRDTPMTLRSAAPSAAFSYYSIHFNWENPSAIPDHPSAKMRYCDEAELDREPAPLFVTLDDGQRLALPFVARAPQLEPFISQVVDDYLQQSFGYELVLRGRMCLLLAELIRHLREEREPEARRKVLPALELMREHPDRSWHVSELASACGYQPAYFAELFKEALGATPKAYMMEQRIRLAKQLLLVGEPIDAISDRLGFGSPPYFHRSFKDATGLTPSEFRMGGR